jgi:hypothetical protein
MRESAMGIRYPGTAERSLPSKYEYEKDGAEIYRRSFATIRAETDLARLPGGVPPGGAAPRRRAGSRS